MDVNIFDIQRFSIFDGPGIRTTVFFKGCSLHCKWCHNPESQSTKKELMIFSSKCVGCGECTKLCEKAHTAGCTACGECVRVCSHEARKIAGRTQSVDEICKTVLRDKQFYLSSGGGVTLSGGEPLLQADAAAELLKKCMESGVSTAVETAAGVGFRAFEKIFQFCDLIICDIKAIDEKTHIDCTGVSNKLILENAVRLKKSGKELLFRMPVVPGFNDGQVGAVAEFTRGFPLELMAYHATAGSKYSALGREFESADAAVPDKEYMLALAKSYGAAFNPAW